MSIDETMNMGFGTEQDDDGLSADELDFEFESDSTFDDDDLDATENDFELDEQEDSVFGAPEVSEETLGITKQKMDIDPDSPEALLVLLEQIRRERPDFYNSFSQAKTSAYCVDEVLESEQNQTIRDAIRFAACTTVAGGEYYYVHNGACTVTGDTSRKIMCESLSDTIKNNISVISDLDDVLCEGCEKNNAECFVAISEFDGALELYHNPCKCVIDRHGHIVKENADAECATCNGGASANDSSCDSCKQDATDLNSYIEKVKKCLELQGGDGLGYEVEVIIEDVVKKLLTIYKEYALQLKPPMGVLTDSQKDENTVCVTVCSGMDTTTGSLPGSYTHKKTYGSARGNFTKNLAELGLIIKESACRLGELRGAGRKFTKLVIGGSTEQLERSRHIAFFGNKDECSSLNLVGKSRANLKWKENQFVSPFSAGGWHSYHVFGEHMIGGKLESLYVAPVTVEEPVLKDGEQVTKKRVVPLSFNEKVETQLRNDIREQVWRFIRDNGGRVVSEYPSTLWSDAQYSGFRGYTLDALIREAGEMQDLSDLRILRVIKEVLYILLTAVIDYIMTFVVVHDCNEFNMTFDLVHFSYTVQTFGISACLGETVAGVFKDLANPNAHFYFETLKDFGVGLRQSKIASMVSTFNAKRDFRGEITSKVANGLGVLGTVYVSKYILVTNPTAYLGYPLFAYEPISRMQELSGGLDSNSILIGETMQGAKVELRQLLDPKCECISLFAASRSGKGVMTLAMLGTMLQSGNPVVYLDGKPEMSGVLVDFILSLNKIAKMLKSDISEAELITTFPAFEFFQPCVDSIKQATDSNSTYHTKMSGTARNKMCEMQRSWLSYANNAIKQGTLNELWKKYFCGSDLAETSLGAPSFLKDGLNPTFSYLLRMKAYYLFYAMNKVESVYRNILKGQRIIVISDEINRCNISAGYAWLQSFAVPLKQSGSAGYAKFEAFAKDYFGKLNWSGTGKSVKLSSLQEASAGLAIQSAIQVKQADEKKVGGTTAGASPLFVLIGQNGSEVYSNGGRLYSSSATSNRKDGDYTQWGTTLETYLMEKAVGGQGYCIQGNWTKEDNVATTEYYQAVINDLVTHGYEEVASHYLHFINDGTISGFFAVKHGANTQIARTYLVLNNNTPEYTEDYVPGSEKTMNNVRPRTYAAILGDAAKDKNKQKTVDETLNRMLFRGYDKLTQADKDDVKNKSKWVREARVGFLGYFGMLLGIDLPDHVFAVNKVDGENPNENLTPNLTSEGEERFWTFFNKFRDSCDCLNQAFRAMPFVSYLEKTLNRQYNSIQEFIYDGDPASFVPLAAMLAENEEEIRRAIFGSSVTNSDDAGKTEEELREDMTKLTETAETDTDITANEGSFESLDLGSVPVAVGESVLNGGASTMNTTAPTLSDANSTFESAFKSVVDQFNTVNGILESKQYYDRYVEAVRAGNMGVMQGIASTLTQMVNSVNQLLEDLETEFGSELATPVSNNPTMTYDDVVGQYVDKYNRHMQTWLNARNSVNQ